MHSFQYFLYIGRTERSAMPALRPSAHVIGCFFANCQENFKNPVDSQGPPPYIALRRPDGGIGRRASFRCWYPKGCGGSSPLLGTIPFLIATKIKELSLFNQVARLALCKKA